MMRNTDAEFREMLTWSVFINRKSLESSKRFHLTKKISLVTFHSEPIVLLVLRKIFWFSSRSPGFSSRRWVFLNANSGWIVSALTECQNQEFTSIHYFAFTNCYSLFQSTQEPYTSYTCMWKMPVWHLNTVYCKQYTNSRKHRWCWQICWQSAKTWNFTATKYNDLFLSFRWLY